MKASKIFHRNEHRIKVEFPHDAETTERIKQLPDAKWSATQKAWHIPYNKIAFADLKKMFPGVEYESKPTIAIDTTDASSPQKTNANVSIQISGRKITVHLPKNEVDTKFLLSFRYSRWDRKQFLDFDTSIMFLRCYKSEGDVDLLKNVVCQFLSTCLEVM